VLVSQLSPTTFEGFVGQERIKARLELAFASAKQRCEPINHILLLGQPGSGKSTLALIIAKAMGASFRSTSGLTVAKEGDLAGLLTNLEDGDVLFIDEIHRLQKNIEEYLYSAMEDFKLDIVIDVGPDARRVHLNLPRFTLIGATSRKERLAHALLSKFRIVEHLDDYTAEDLAAVARRFAKLLNLEVDDDAAGEIARSANGTPLEVLNRLHHVRDYAQVKADARITVGVAVKALQMLAPASQADEFDLGRSAIPSDVRREVWRRDGGKCAKCGSRRNLEYDHIIPVSKGGSNTARNIELLCEICNGLKRGDIR
jgi:holliday junction DNA helicase RuvB